MNDDNTALYVTLDNSLSVKYKASLLGKATDADGNDRSLKKYKNSSAFKISRLFFLVTRNAID